MHRRRLGLALAILAFGTLIAVKPKTGEIRLSLDLPETGDAARAEAALEVGTFAISVLVNAAR
jgi:hypothetical protein